MRNGSLSESALGTGVSC